LSEGVIDKSLLRRFWSKIDKSCKSGCWEWTAHFSGGYGRLRIFRDGSWRYANANRLSWEIHYSEIPDGLFVCHKCDNMKCVNPEHLFIGSQLDNMKDCSNKGRQAKGSDFKRSAITEEDVRTILAMEKQGFTQQQIADKFNVSRPNIHYIVSRKTWKHVS
jgi:predicted XRE-type DNA-binding protein